MLDFIYTLFIAPLEFGMDKALSWGYELTGNWGWAIIVMSLIVNTVILPIYLKAEHWQEEERNIRKSFENDEAMIKRTFKGQERFAMITTMHRQAGYSPLLTLRSSIGFFLQIPFFFAAYHLLSHFEPLQGIAFLGLHDLAKPDELFKIGNFTVNFMPILMTVINIASALIYTSNLSKRDKYQLYGMAALFLVLLYNAASGLVLYWTFNNIYSLCKNVILTRCKSQFEVTKKAETCSPSYCWTLPLGIALPFIFLWANNIFAYTLEALLLCSAIVFTGCLVTQYGLKLIKFQNREFFILIYAVVLGLAICFTALTIIKGAFYAYRWHFIWILPLTLWVLIRCFGFRFVNILFSTQIILSIGIACYNIGSDYKTSQEINKGFVSQEFIKFEQKPNIYLFFCESYQNLKTVKEIFGYDSSNFLDQLSSLGLVIYDNVYSNSSYTLGSLRDLTTMQYKFASVGNLDAFSSEREIFGGGVGNLLFKTLKANGYETTFFVNGVSGFFTKKGIYLDHTDYRPDPVLLLLTPLLDSSHYFEKLASLFIKTNHVAPSETDVVGKLKNRPQNSEKPQFYVHYLLTAFHTPSDGSYNYKMKDEWTENSGYVNQIKKANQTILEVVQYLRHNDPKSIIIFVGDHGPWRIRDFPYDLKNKSHNKAKLAEINETYQSVVDDYFHVFSAIYYPDGFNPISKFSHVNLFPQLFHQLAPNSTKAIAKIECKDNYSIYDGHIMAIDGKAEETTLFWP